MQLLGFHTPALRREFLDTCWQKSHRFLPEALVNFADPVTADDLAALAMMDGVESRIVEGPEFDISHGPFSREKLESFPQANASLLVQSVDQFDEEVAGILAAFDFIPGWRRDDVMVSFSTEGGGVGPHFDLYDVFLIQGEGQRLWRIGQHCDATTQTIDSSGHRILAAFDQQAEYLMSPGDILYVPPGVAHWGTSINNSLTYSIGFRAPSIAEFSEAWLDQVATYPPSLHRYQDDNPLPLSPDGIASARISESSIRRLQTALKNLASDSVSVATALGILQTEQRMLMAVSDEEPDPNESALRWEDVERELALSSALKKNLLSRVCYYESEESSLVFVDGLSWSCGDCSAWWLEILCSATSVSTEVIRKACVVSEGNKQWRANQDLLLLLLNQNVWRFTE